MCIMYLGVLEKDILNKENKLEGNCINSANIDISYIPKGMIFHNRKSNQMNHTAESHFTATSELKLPQKKTTS